MSPLTDFTPGTPIVSADVDANFAICVLTDTAKTIAVKHTVSVQNPFAFTHADWANGALCYTTSDNLTALAPGTAGQVLVMNIGATAPQWVSSISITNGEFGGTLGVTGHTGVTTITASGAMIAQSTLAVTGAVTLTTALTTANGGTGLTSYTAGDIVYYAAGTLLSKLGIGAANRILTSSGTAPQWVEDVTIGGTLAVTGVSTFTGDVVAAVIRRATSDASDSGVVVLTGGGASGNTRGGSVTVHGNEHANTGQVLIEAGNVASGEIKFSTFGAEVMRLDRNATANQTRMMVFDVDNNTLERVGVGAGDSGGSGFKVLRIPN